MQVDSFADIRGNEVFSSNVESSKMISSGVTILHGKTINLSCKPLFSFTLENTLILFMDSMNCPIMAMNFSNFFHSFKFLMFLPYFQETAKEYCNMKKMKSWPKKPNN